jgi:hypothetical protein
MIDSIAECIQAAYERLGHQWGWRFMATPARTLSAETDLAVVTLNPGAAIYNPPVVSVEEGNAYRIERWEGNRNIQIQMGRMYEELAARWPRPVTATELMDSSLAAHFCPFRSPNWRALASRSESIEFSRQLWRYVLAVVNPGVMICLGEAGRQLAGVMESAGAVRTRPVEIGPVGWRSDPSGGGPTHLAPPTNPQPRRPHRNTPGRLPSPASARQAPRRNNLDMATLRRTGCGACRPHTRRERFDTGRRSNESDRVKPTCGLAWSRVAKYHERSTRAALVHLSQVRGGSPTLKPPLLRPMPYRQCSTRRPDGTSRSASGARTAARRGSGSRSWRGRRAPPGEQERAHQQAIAAWNNGPSHQPDRQTFEAEVVPRLRQLRISEMVAATGLSEHYCSLIRLGKRTPHLQHWDALRRAAGLASHAPQ